MIDKKFRNFYVSWFINFFPRYFDTFDEYIAAEYNYEHNYIERFYVEYCVSSFVDYQEKVAASDLIAKRVFQMQQNKLAIESKKAREEKWEDMTPDEWWEDITRA